MERIEWKGRQGGVEEKLERNEPGRLGRIMAFEQWKIKWA